MFCPGTTKHQFHGGELELVPVTVGQNDLISTPILQRTEQFRGGENGLAEFRTQHEIGYYLQLSSSSDHMQ